MNQFEFNNRYRNNVGICYWTKKSLTNGDTCYKNKFYGIPTSQCLEFTPNPNICNLNCKFCWRNPQYNNQYDYDYIELENYIRMFINLRKHKLGGYYGNNNVEREKLNYALYPRLWTISYSGEPTIFNNLDKLIQDIRKFRIKVFLVSNGTLPERILTLKNLPDQLYISVSAYDYNSFSRITNMHNSSLWANINYSLDMLSNLNCRTVLKIIVIKEFNITYYKELANLVTKSKASYVEIKSFENIGRSIRFLDERNVPDYYDILNFTEKIAERTGYLMVDSDQRSKAFLLAKDSHNMLNRFIF